LPVDGYLHGETPTADDDLIYQGSAGDTDYYVIDSGIVPILRPLGSLGVPHFLLSALNEPVQVLIESAFRRDLGPGVPAQASLLPHVNPITLAINLIKSIPVGIDNALEELGVGRKLGTTPSGPYGVGGPQLPAPPVTAMTTMSALSASEAVEPDAPQVDSLAKDAGTRKSMKRKPRRPSRIPPRRPIQSPSRNPLRRRRSRNHLQRRPIIPRCAGRSSSTHRRR
jgi:hypothetical protein